MSPAVDKSRAVEHYTHQAALAAALTLSRTLENATLWPWVLKLTYTLAGGQVTSTHIVESSVRQPPNELEYLPAGAEAVTADVFPASRFDDMPLPTRARYAPQYRAFLLWRAAKAIGKRPEDMRAWVDYCPVGKDDRVQSWLRPGRFIGD